MGAMPDLPILTVSQAHFDRIVAAFPGDTLAKKAAAYKAWSTNNLIQRVREVEVRKITEQAEAAKRAKIAELVNLLPPMQEDPDAPPPFVGMGG